MAARHLAAAVLALVAALLGTALWLGNRPLQVPPEYPYILAPHREVDPELVAWQEVTRIPVPATLLQALAADSSGNCYVAADGALFRFDAAGQETARTPLDATPLALAVAPGGTVYLGLPGRIAVIAAGAAARTFADLGERGLPTGLAADRERVLVADAGHRQVWRFAADGRLQDHLGGRDPASGEPRFVVPSPYFDLLPEAGGGLWVANPGRQRVERWSADGRMLGHWGSAGMDLAGFAGCCNPSHLARLPGGGFVTGEKGLSRVKEYGPDGGFRSVVATPDQLGADGLARDLAVDATGRVLLLDPAQRAVRVFARKTDQPQARRNDG